MSRSKFQREEFDWLLLGSYLALVIMGLLMIYATTYHDVAGTSMWAIDSAFGRQFIWSIISLFAVGVLVNIDWSFWNTLSIPLYILGLLTLLILLVVGTEINGAKSWLILGPLSLQPSELVKVSTAIYSASLLSSIRIRLDQWQSQVQLLLVMAAPAVLIILQPDPGSALTFGSLLIAFYRKGMPTSYYIIAAATFLTLILSMTLGFYVVSAGIFLLGLFALLDLDKSRTTIALVGITLLLANILAHRYNLMRYAVVLDISICLGAAVFFGQRKPLVAKASILGGLTTLAGLSYVTSYAFENILKPHQQDRINVWLKPSACDPRGSLYNLLQSKLAIGSGGLTGKGYLQGTLTKLNYVPAQTTDFIFSSIGEEQGFVGCIALILLFMILIYRILLIGEGHKSGFAKYLCYCFAGFIFVHVFINIGMTMGVTPVIGIPLPFISKGGSSMLAFSMMIGMVLSISRNR
ncbi:MAG: rod shape-determining protein RodA [Bacteroidota bacterium]